MKLLVTGGLGFIGSNFILHAFKKYPKIKITNIDALLSGSNTQNLAELKSKNYKFVRGNITNGNLIEKLVSKSDVVINFAAESHVDRSISDPRPFLESNIMGVYTILEAVRKYKKKLVQISTDEVFGSLKSESAAERHPYNPSSPYAASKAAAENLVNSYFITYDCDVAITRCTNNYGPRQAPEKLIPKTIFLADKNKKIPIYGTGKNIRDWIFVLDHCDAILQILLKGKKGESYNISANNEVDNLTIVRKILKIMGKSEDLIEFISDRPGHDFRYSLNSGRIRRKLAWRPSHKFEDGLRQTINWYQQNKEWRRSISKNTFTISWKTR